MSTLFKSMVSLALALAISLSASSGASADRRVALVIGNVKYQYAGLLPNTVNDANAIADLLKGVGFDVIDQRSDLGVDDFRQAVQQFIQLSFDADVAVIYFSGYGSVIDGVNYLVPVDSTLSSAREVEDQAISLKGFGRRGARSEIESDHSGRWSRKSSSYNQRGFSFGGRRLFGTR